MAILGGKTRFGAIFAGTSAVGLDGAQLLDRFAATRDEAAFEAIVARHGPMVLATCRRILPQETDADDAFQATFLILARRAASIGDPDRLAPWLHGVARRVAARARSQAVRRQALAGDDAGVADAASSAPPADAGELRAVLDEELARLPPRFRDVLVLCYLEGLTHDEAAGQLRCPLGTVRSRLAAGRDRLRARLARRGFAPGAAVVLAPANLPLAVVSPILRMATVRLAGTAGGPSARIAATFLAQGVLTSMFLTKVQTAALTTLAVAATLAVGTTGLVVARQEPAAMPQPAPAPESPPPGTDLPTPLDLDRELLGQLSNEISTISKQLEQLRFDQGQRQLRLENQRAAKEIQLEALKLALRQRVARGEANPAPPRFDLGGFMPAADAKTSEAALARIKILEAELAAVRRIIEPVPIPATAEGLVPAKLTKPASPPPQTPVAPAPPAQAEPARPEPRPEVLLVPNSALLMTISAERDRITMVDPATRQRAILRLDRAVTRVEPVACMSRDAWIGLILEGPAITKLAVFEPAAMRWHEHTLARSATFAYPNAQTSRSRIPFHLEGADIAEAVVFDLESRIWFSEPLRGGPQQRLTTVLEYVHDPKPNLNPKFTVVSQAGRFFYFLSPTEPRWTVLEVRQAPVDDHSHVQRLINFDRVVTVPGLRSLPGGSLCVQDGNDLVFYNPRTAELTRVDTATEK